ncbi:TPA: cytochrome d ubiquinol oxidase subunit II, partial [Klebsiella pneumoniae]|nr:cytochrome d ubiquinol oxidase subunit II [Klebsiella pneumoniae]
MGIDLPLIWFVIIIFSTLMYIVMDGFDLGTGILYPFVKSNADRDLMMNSVAPVWDGNETWLVLGGAALFGAFPLAYAVILDALAIPLTLMLVALIFRGVAFEFRFKADEHHRYFWD